MEKQAIFAKMKELLVENFELEPDAIHPGALLMQDLDLDSIDAVDLVVQLQKYTDRKIDPEVFKKVRTIQDVVDAIYGLMGEPAAREA